MGEWDSTAGGVATVPSFEGIAFGDGGRSGGVSGGSAAHVFLNELLGYVCVCLCVLGCMFFVCRVEVSVNLY